MNENNDLWWLHYKPPDLIVFKQGSMDLVCARSQETFIGAVSDIYITFLSKVLRLKLADTSPWIPDFDFNFFLEIIFWFGFGYILFGNRVFIVVNNLYC